MSDQKMDVFLLAAPQAGVERSTLVSNLAAAFKKDVPTIEKMLRRPRTLVKADVGMELAAKYKALIEKSGGQCELAIHGQAPAPLPNEAPKAQSLVLEPLATTKVEAEEDNHSDAVGYCTKCGTVLRAGDTKCAKCFTPVTAMTSKDKTTAGFLALFFGGFGVHRLYLGQWWGVIYLLFWGTLIPSIVSIVEAIVFWSTSKEKWNEKYGNVPKNSAVMAAVFIVSIFFFIGFTGILAAIALPAYQDYTNRAKIQSAMPLVLEARNKVENFIKRTKTFPTDNILVGLPDDISNDVVTSIKLQEGGKLEVAYSLSTLKDRNTIVWVPVEQKGEIAWTCMEGTMLDKNRPKECRGGEQANSASVPGKKKITSNSTLGKKISSADKHISIRVPETWTAKELLPTALIGATDSADENYIVVLEDSKIDFEDNLGLDRYNENTQKQLMANIKNGQIQGVPKDLQVANLPAKQFVFLGTAEGIKIGYVITLIESDKSFYRILAWTTQSRLEKNKMLLQKVSESFATK